MNLPDDLEPDDRSFIWVFGDLDDPRTDTEPDGEEQ